MRALAAVALCAWIGCSSAAPGARGGVTQDAGGDIDVGAARCMVNAVSCSGVCMPETVDTCGADCVQCGQPAPSHGAAGCTDGTCSHSCEAGYSLCGVAGCCGGATAGDVELVAVGGSTSCAVTSIGTVFCWGDGSYGTLGDGTVQTWESLPTQVEGIRAPAVTVTLGDHHACAITVDGAVACWGDDDNGQLGDGKRDVRSTAFTPPGFASGIAQISAGAAHTCALTTSGGAKCWGSNLYGQLGSGTSGANVTNDVVGLTSGVTAVAAGAQFSCAVMTGGDVRCWGDGARGELGGPERSNSPVAIALPAPAIAVAAGGRHACARLMDGRVFCWGADDANQLGSGSAGAHPISVEVPGLGVVATLSAGGDETCVVDSTGKVTCWGAHPIGDVAPGPAGPGVVPSLESGVAMVAVGENHVCAVTAGGATKCWGSNGTGQLGDGTTTDSWVPIDAERL